MRSRSRSLVSVLLGVTAAVVAFAAFLPVADAQPRVKYAPLQPSTARIAPSQLNLYGDSFISGVGIEPANPGTYDPALPVCKRSSISYAELLNDELNNRPYIIPFLLPKPMYPDMWVHNATCGGAQTADITTVEQHAGIGTQLSQVPPIPQYRSGVSVVSIGGNDLGFQPVLTNCVLTVDCHIAAAIPEIANIQANMDALVPVLAQTYVQILQNREPFSKHRVFVVGYPQLFGPEANCAPAVLGPGFEIDAAERAWMDQLALDLNAEIQALTATMRAVTYVDIDDVFDGHRICDAVPWLTGLVTADLGESFHPNALGHAAILPEVLAAIDAAGM